MRYFKIKCLDNVFLKRFFVTEKILGGFPPNSVSLTGGFNLFGSQAFILAHCQAKTLAKEK